MKLTPTFRIDRNLFLSGLMYSCQVSWDNGKNWQSFMFCQREESDIVMQCRMIDRICLAAHLNTIPDHIWQLENGWIYEDVIYPFADIMKGQ